ncbi:hypothetical protein [uncultured Pseudoflavonifractor sp.]|uniref:hypothetical protein n=1 Tax=uncultured Pseudoflavonifractor sp. TaxID=1221379 RepID=UPI0025F26C4C|nr:hypothetical protein [uncultured Pseudoflavonifractor sp.]
MEKQFSAVGQGLMKVFFGVCLSAAYVLLNTTGLVLGLMPLRVLSAIMCLAVFFMVFVGLSASSIVESGYWRAIWCARGSAVVGLLAALIMDNALLILLLAVVRQLMEIAGIAVVCRLSSRLMAERDGERDAGRGKWTWRLCTLCGCGGILCAGVIFYIRNTKMMPALVLAYLVLQLLNRLIFMVFLYRSRGVLKEQR